MLDIIAQVCIFVFGISSIILVSKKNKWGFVLGFLGQPFYLYITYTAKQWGIFFTALAYTISWAFGIYE